MVESDENIIPEKDVEGLLMQLEGIYKNTGINQDPRKAGMRLVTEIAGIRHKMIDIHGYSIVLDRIPDEHTSFVISRIKDTSWVAQIPWLNGWPPGARAVLVTSTYTPNTSYKVAPATLADVARVRSLLIPAGKI